MVRRMPACPLDEHPWALTGAIDMRAAKTSKQTSESAADYLPPRRSLASLRHAEQHCHGCELYNHATQAVGGEGPVDASIVIVGEVPGDVEDRLGHPFVGPAGKLLDAALESAGISRKEVFLTNAVKHFKWEPRGTRRLHSKPSAREIAACRPWLDAELELLDPRIIVCLGATAAQALLGKAFRITKHRGEVVRDGDRPILATWHPSAVLRAPDESARHEMRQELIADLRIAVGVAAGTRR